MKKDSLFEKLWQALWPLAIYVIAQNLFGLIFVPLNLSIAAILAAAVVCIPIYYKMYRQDRIKLEGKDRERALENKELAAIVVSGAALALAMNNVISITPLPYLFTGYEKTNEVIYSGNILLQILSAGIFGCIVEELCMRGILYPRLKQCCGKRKAMFISALIFGLYHLNLVQTVYAFALGLYFVWLYERYDNLWASIVGHMSANFFILLLAGSTMAARVMNTWVGFCLITCISILIFYYSFRWMQQTEEKNELEFVEKAPDTLEQLTEEYKRKDTGEENS